MCNIYAQPIDILEAGKIKARLFAEDIFQLGYQLVNSFNTAVIAQLREDPGIRADLKKVMLDFERLHGEQRDKYHSQYAEIDASDNTLKIRKFRIYTRKPGPGKHMEVTQMIGSVRDMEKIPIGLLQQLITSTLHQITAALELRYILDDYFDKNMMDLFRHAVVEISTRLVQIISKGADGQVPSKFIIVRFSVEMEFITTPVQDPVY